MMQKQDKIFVAGHRGLAGSAIVRKLSSLGYENILTRTSGELDLTNNDLVKDFLLSEKPDYVFLAAAKVGGIKANNDFPADFIYQNLCLQNSVIHNSYLAKVKRLLFLGSSCVYPRDCPQPIKEEYLLTGPLEKTNDAYAIAKIAGLKMCESYNRQYGTRFLAVMPTNLYGPFDNYDLENSHVLPALIRRFHEAKERGDERITLWGSGTPQREFLHSDDMASACIFLMNQPDEKVFAQHFELFNIGCGKDIAIKDLATLIARITGFKGIIDWDTTKPDGTPRKLLNVDRLAGLGWTSCIELEEGIKRTCESYLAGQVRNADKKESEA